MRAEVLTKSLDDALRRTLSGTFIASVRALSVALITSVARIDRSLVDKQSSASSCIFSWSTLLVREFVVGFFVVFKLAVAAVFVGFFEVTGIFGFGTADFGRSKSLSVVTVSGVQVDVELTAARIDCTVACRDDMMIQAQSIIGH